MKDDLYDQVANELRQKKVMEGIWLRALIETQNSIDRAKQLYVTLRVKYLQARVFRRAFARVGVTLLLTILCIAAASFITEHMPSGEYYDSSAREYRPVTRNPVELAIGFASMIVLVFGYIGLLVAIWRRKPLKDASLVSTDIVAFK